VAPIGASWPSLSRGQGSGSRALRQPKLQLFTVEKQAGLVRGEQEVGGLELS
jgi:hypothetical protein